MDDENGDPICNNGLCEAPEGARGIVNCIHCGKELHEKDGKWYTWDADFTDYPIPQDYIK